MDDREIVFVKYGESSRVKHGSTRTQHGQRILRMNQNVPADDCVELTSSLPLMHIGMQALDVSDPFCDRTTL